MTLDFKNLIKKAWNYNYIHYRGTGIPTTANKFSPRFDVSVKPIIPTVVENYQFSIVKIKVNAI